MNLDPFGILRDAWEMAKRDRQLLLAVAGVFLFLPNLVQTLFVAPPPPFPDFSDQTAVAAWVQQVTLWSQSYELIVIGAALVALFGTLALFLLYADRSRPTVSGALGKALSLLPYYLLLALSTTIPVGLGYLLLILPGLYLKGRLLPVYPVFVAERPIGIVGAWQRSFALTRGAGFVLMGLACVPLLGGWLLALPFNLLGTALSGAALANPVSALLIDGGIALAQVLATLAAVLIEVALYRRLSSGT
jgi:hypothetical protein